MRFAHNRNRSHHSHDANNANPTKNARTSGGKLTRRVSSATKVGVALAACVVIASVIGVFVVQAANKVWAGTGGSSAWLTAGNWTGGVPGSGDVAQFDSATNTANTVGIAGTATQTIQAVEFTSNRANPMAIGASGTTGGAVSLQLNGTTINSVANTVIRNNSPQLMTIQANNGQATPNTLSLVLGNATDNIINIDSTGGVTISSIISGAGRKLTRAGAGTGTLTLSGVNTYSGNTTISTGTLALNGAGSIANSPVIEVAGSATFNVAALTTALTLSTGQALKATGSGNSGTIATVAAKGLTTAANSPLQFTAYDGVAAPLTVVGGGTVTLASGNVVAVTVANGGTPLAAGDYIIMARDATSSVAGTVPTSLTVNGDGIAAGTMASLQITGARLVLHIANPDYAVTTTGSAIVVTDTSGNADTLTISEPSANNIKFATPGRTFSVNGGAFITGDSGNISTAGINSITVNQGNGDDTANVGAFTSTLPTSTINGDGGSDAVNFNGDITFTANASLNVDLQNDPGAAGADSVTLAANANLLTSGTGAVTVKASKNVVMTSNSSFETVDGGVVIEANQQGTPTAGNFTGLDIAAGALVRTTGSGNISLLGKGGADGATANHRGIISVGTITSTSGAGGAGTITLNGVGGGAGSSGNNGVQIIGGAIVSSVNGNVSFTGQGGAATGSSNYGVTMAGTGTVIQSTGTATVTLMGTGGAGVLGNSGVSVDLNAVVTSAVGDIQITGQGAGTSASNLGVIVNGGAAVSSTGAAKVTINGTGGSGGTTALVGVNIQGVSGANHARVTSTGGDISITGVAGSGSGSSNIGVIINSGGAVTATGAAKVTIAGTGSSGTLVNPGVYVDSFGVAGTTISAVNGDISITGVATDTTGTNQDGVVFQDSSAAVAVAVTTTGTGTITLNGTAANNDPTSAGIHLVDDTSITTTGASNSFIADTMTIGSSAVTVNAGANAITLRQTTNGIAIDLGGADSATQLGLTDTELDRFTAGTLNIGNASSGAITVSAGITRAAATALNLTSGANIDIAGGSVNSNGGNVNINQGTNFFPSNSGVDVTTGAAATLTLASGKDLKSTITSTTVDSGYTQLNVAGLINLNGANLSFAGSTYTPVGSESFTIVNNDGADAITGTFANGPTYTNFLGSGLTATISYTGGDGNDAVLTVAAACGPQSIVYVDDSWVGTTPGTDPDMGGPATNFGCDSFATIQNGVNGVTAGGTVNVAAGTYVENVAIPKALTLTGAGAASVFLKPATSDPNCGGLGGGSLCAGAVNLILVQASNVTISGLTLDGDNPALTSAYNIGGANVDARNGIITNHLAGTFNNLEVHHTTVKNIYLRGVYASSGGSFNFHDNTVDNVQGEAASIGMFSFSGAGANTNNNVSNCNDAISANNSRGISFTGNTVTTSASGIHTDNAGSGGGTNDTISGNTVTNSTVNGFGVWTFVPYLPITVSNNTVTNVDVGLAAAGGISTPVATTFTGNTVDGQNKVNSTGVYLTTDQFGFGQGNNLVEFKSNTVINNVDGFFVEAKDSTGAAPISVFATHPIAVNVGEPGYRSPLRPALAPNVALTLTANVSFNRIVNNTGSSVTHANNLGTLAGTFENNWWGCNAGPNNAGCGNIVGSGVDFDPWIVLGISASPATIPPGGSSTITADMTHNSANALVSGPDFVPQVAVTFGATNGTVFPTSGTITNGQATTTFTSNSTSSGSASATVDNQTVNTPVNVSAANTYTWSPLLGSTNYLLPTNWTPTRFLPQANDNLVINGTTTSAPIITNVPTQTIAGLHLINGPQVTLQASGTITLTINGATGSDLTVPAGSFLTLDGGNGLTIKVTGSGTSGTVGGVFIELGGPHRLFGDGGGVITFQNNSLATTGTGVTGNPFGTGAVGDGAAGSVIFQSGSSYFHNGGGSPFGVTPNPAVVVFQTGSLATFNTATGFEASGRTYANLAIGKADPGGIPVAASDSGAGNFQFDDLTLNSTSSATSSLNFTGSGTSTITIRGNVLSTGAGNTGTLPDVILTPGSGETHIQKVGPGTLTFSTTGNARAVDLEGGATVESGTTLALARVVQLGLSNPHLNFLTVATGADISGGPTGYVVGSLSRVQVPNGSSSFPVGTAGEYSPVDLDNSSGLGSLTVVARTPQQPLLAQATSLNRYWSLTHETGSLTSDLTFHYLDGDVFGNEASYRLVIAEGGNATNFPDDCPNTCVDESANTIHRVGVSTFSDWTAAEPLAPTAVKLASFNATRLDNGEVMLRWQSGYEANNLGYNVYREQNGKRVAITPSLVAGSALLAGRQTTLTAGLSYTWTDDGRQTTASDRRATTAVGGRQSSVVYWLEDVDLSGARTLHGPIAIAECGMANVDCKKLAERSQLLSEISKQQSAISNQQSGVVLSAYPAAVTAPDPGDPEPDPTEMQRTIAGLPGLKISVSRPGWYRISQPDVLAAGFNIADANGLQLYRDGRQVALRLSNSTEQFGPTDYLEFYGEGLSSTTASAQTYYLVKLADAGKRIEPKEKAVGPGDRVSPQGFAYTVERKERMIYFSGLLNGDAENFFGQLVSSAAVNSTIPVAHLDVAAGSLPQLEVVLQGVTSQSHLVQVRVNGMDVGTISFANTDHPHQTFSVPAGVVHDGNNTIELTALGGGGDVSLVDVLRLTYVRGYEADNNALAFNLSSRQTKRLTGFTSDHIRVVDVSDPYNVLELTPDVAADGAGFAALIGVDREVRAPFSRPHELLAFADGDAQAVDAIHANDPSTWWSESAGADYLIVTTGDLKASTEPLRQLRQAQGLVVKLVDVEDLYDEFTFGAHSPQAIHDFLARAMSNWTLKPHYVVLAGDASLDPKNYFGQGLNDLVPTKLIDTTLTETASDDWLVDFNNDGISDVAIGRLPVRTAANMNLLVAKIVNYENATPDPARGALLVSDTGFEGANGAVHSLLPSGMPVATVNRSSADDATIHNQIIAGLNQGPLVTNYVGHGSNGVWTGASLLSLDDAPLLTNSRLSVFTMMTCYNGFFQNAFNDSLAEALLQSQGGAVAVWASTTLTQPEGQNAIDQEFYRLLFGNQPATIGDAARAAKFVTGDADVRRTWTLFGDPAMRLR